MHAKHTDMVLLHGGSPKGAEKIAACWPDNRKYPQIVFKPDWTRHVRAAPFKRNDKLLETLPIGLIVSTHSGITDNLTEKTRAMGVPLYDFDSRKGVHIVTRDAPRASHMRAPAHSGARSRALHLVSVVAVLEVPSSKGNRPCSYPPF